MAHLWSWVGRQWALAFLDQPALAMTGDAERPVRPWSAAEPAPGDVLLRQRSGADGEAWLLIAHGARRDVRVNGLALAGGLRELQDRDSVRLGGAQFFFSTERLARPIPFPGAGSKVVCPRCRREIRVGEEAIRCPSPRCGVWHHESPSFPCWSYAETCAQCDQPTVMEAEFRWTPEHL